MFIIEIHVLQIFIDIFVILPLTRHSFTALLSVWKKIYKRNCSPCFHLLWPIVYGTVFFYTKQLVYCKSFCFWNIISKICRFFKEKHQLQISILCKFFLGRLCHSFRPDIEHGLSSMQETQRHLWLASGSWRNDTYLKS